MLGVTRLVASGEGRAEPGEEEGDLRLIVPNGPRLKRPRRNLEHKTAFRPRRRHASCAGSTSPSARTPRAIRWARAPTLELAALHWHGRLELERPGWQSL